MATQTKLKKENEELKELLKKCLPIVREAFWDHHTAGCLPGSGYHHRVYRQVSATFGWRESKTFETFDRRARTLVGEEPVLEDT